MGQPKLALQPKDLSSWGWINRMREECQPHRGCPSPLPPPGLPPLQRQPCYPPYRALLVHSTKLIQCSDDSSVSSNRHISGWPLSHILLRQAVCYQLHITPWGCERQCDCKCRGNKSFATITETKLSDIWKIEYRQTKLATEHLSQTMTQLQRCC